VRILAFDTSGSACAAAVLADGRCLAHAGAAPVRDHAERLLPMLAAVLAEAGLRLADLDGLAVTLGPGGFTGIRAGVAAARGLKLATGLPLVGLGTLEATAANLEAADFPALVVHDARREEAYVQAFAALERPLAPPALRPLAAAGDGLPAGRWSLLGTGAAAAAPALQARGLAVRLAGPPLPDPARWWPLAAPRLVAAREAPPPAPLYIRAPDARLPPGPPP